jgi:GcrA cell cycle regulator
MSWTNERVTELKALWADGLSANQIARQLGGTTRNAVIGKVHRLGLSNRGAPSNPGTRPARTTSKARKSEPRLARPKRSMPAVANGPPRTQVTVRACVAVDDSPGLATVMNIANHMCRWPIGDPLKEGFTLCGRKTRRGSYCEEHAQVAFLPVTTETKRSASALAKSLRRYL